MNKESSCVALKSSLPLEIASDGLVENENTLLGNDSGVIYPGCSDFIELHFSSF